jgi:1-acyl-sn-glycerol-3-phosphate acyltransferase
MLSTLRAALVTDPLIVLATILMGTLSLAASLFDSSGRTQHRIAVRWGRMLLAIGGVRLRVEGAERIRSGAACVYASNHASYMDIPTLLAGLPGQFRFMAKRGLWRVPFIGYHLKRAGHIPVEREDPRAALKSMSEAARIVRERGVPVLVFPEGGRSPSGLRGFKEGAAYIAIKAGVPLVPVALVGTRQVLPMDSLLVQPAAVTLRVGEPIPTAGLRLHDRQALTAQVRDRIVELIHPAEIGV